MSSTTCSGDILTDEHVVAGAIAVKVHFQDGVTAPATVLGSDASTDVAVDQGQREVLGAASDPVRELE